MKTEPLFAEPHAPRRALSGMYTGKGAYRAAAPRWSKLRVKTPLPCDECFALQHETQGACGPRADAKHRRSLPGATLNLCTAHADLWRELDAR